MIIQSLLDSDLYKYTMMQVVAHNFPFVDVEYEFKCRNEDVDLRPYRVKIEKEIDNLCSLTFTVDELNYLRTIPYLNKRFIDNLQRFKLNRNNVIITEENNKLVIRIVGNWFQTILFEVPILAIVNEVYFEHATKYTGFPAINGTIKLDKKIELLKNRTRDSYRNNPNHCYNYRRTYMVGWKTNSNSSSYDARTIS